MSQYRRTLAITLLALTGLFLSGCHFGNTASSVTSAIPIANHATHPLAAPPTTGFTPWGSYRTVVYSTILGTPSLNTSTPTGALGSVTLSWTPPTANTDGSTLTNLAGYYIDYGTQSGSYTNTIQVANPGLSAYVVQNLAPGTYYFVITAYNSDGTQSAYSQQVSMTVT